MVDWPRHIHLFVTRMPGAPAIAAWHVSSTPLHAHGNIGHYTAALRSMALAAAVCRAGRPLTIDDAAPVDRGRWQIGAGAALRKDADTHG